MAQGYGPPPGSPPPPYGMPPAPYGGGLPTTNSALAAIQERSGVTVILLSFVTCGVYYLIWKYKTTEELRAASGDAQLNATTDLLITLVCFFYAIFTDFRNAKKAYELLRANGSNRTDQSTIVLVCHLMGFGFASIYLIQEDLNALARLGRGQQ